MLSLEKEKLLRFFYPVSIPSPMVSNLIRWTKATKKKNNSTRRTYSRMLLCLPSGQSPDLMMLGLELTKRRRTNQTRTNKQTNQSETCSPKGNKPTNEDEEQFFLNTSITWSRSLEELTNQRPRRKKHPREVGFLVKSNRRSFKMFFPFHIKFTREAKKLVDSNARIMQTFAQKYPLLGAMIKRRSVTTKHTKHRRLSSSQPGRTVELFDTHAKPTWSSRR